MNTKIPRNRSAEAKAKGKKLAMFEITGQLDALIEDVRVCLARQLGSCTRTQALENMARRGAEIILKIPPIGP